jgi:Alw26I/Eco31I/Esp3I family type II restriction m6 adenine DNA methyltransferase
VATLKSIRFTFAPAPAYKNNRATASRWVARMAKGAAQTQLFQDAVENGGPTTAQSGECDFVIAQGSGTCERDNEKDNCMEHVELATDVSSRSDIRKRLVGQFYTPEEICNELAQHATSDDYQPESVGDPFCGDGRTMLAWLRAAKRSQATNLRRLRRIVLWDYDERAVSIARSRVQTALGELASTVMVEAIVCDTFERATHNLSPVDLIITNPPWDLLKPDSRDAVPENHRERYVLSIRAYTKRIAAAYNAAASEGRKGMAGYEVNLARAGLLASVRLLSSQGRIGIVLPASIFCDQASGPFRRSVFSTLRVQDLSYIPAEARAFTGVDQPFVTLVAHNGRGTDSIVIVRRDAQLKILETRTVLLEPAHIGAPIPLVLGGAPTEIVQSLSKKHPRLRMLELDMRFGLWLGRELDETRISQDFTREGVPFLKGRQVTRFAVLPHMPPRIDPKRRSIPSTVAEHRLAWRDVSRPNQKRRVQAAIVPEGWVTGNSLGVAFFRYGPPDLTLCLLGVLNSVVFELQVRARLLTAHVSLGAMRECVIPIEVFENERVRSETAKAVLACTQSPLVGAMKEAILEVAIAKTFGMNRDDFAAALDGFAKVTQSEREMLLGRQMWA